MAIFRSKSKAPRDAPMTLIEQVDVKLGRGDKIKTDNVHDPILQAVNEAQPFEQAAFGARGNQPMEQGPDGQPMRRPSYLSQASNELKDIFGQPIVQKDMSNPTRSRNERPLDTIRGFEYAITGDMGYRDQLETSRLGWGFHEDFHHSNLNELARASGAGGASGMSAPDFARPGAAFSQPMYEQNNYSALSLKNSGKKKKRGGLFGKKKNKD